MLLDAAAYWSDPSGVSSCLQQAEASPELLRQRREAARQRSLDYDWDDVTDRYEALCQRLWQNGHRARRGAATSLEATE